MPREYDSDRSNGNTLKQEMWRIEDRLVKAIADSRDDARTSEVRLSKELEDTKDELVGWHEDHDQTHREIMVAHTARQKATDEALDSITTTVAAAAQAKAVEVAKREGALSVLLLIINTLGKNWAVVLAILGSLLFVTNNLHISLT